MNPKRTAFEPLALVLLSLATVGTAWCSFQAAAWGGLSQRLLNLSAASSRSAVTAQLQSYQMALLDVLLFSQIESQRLWQQAGEAGRTSRSYVLITVLLASVLFCGGTASKFDVKWIRRAVVGLGLAAFVFAAARLMMLPVQM